MSRRPPSAAQRACPGAQRPRRTGSRERPSSDPDREPGRDRAARHPRVSGSRRRSRRRLLATPTPTRLHVRGRRGGRLGPHRRPRATCGRRSSRPPAQRRRGDPPRLRLPVGERRTSRARSSTRAWLSGRRPRRSTRSATSSARRGHAGGRAVVPGTIAPVDRADRSAIIAIAERDRLPAARQGRRGRGRRGMRRRRTARDSPAALAGRRRGRVGVRRRVGLPGAGSPGATSRSSCSGTRRARRRPRRARLLAPAPPPEARRGVARAGPDVREAGAPRDGGPAATAVGLTNAATARVPVRPGRRFYFLEVNARSRSSMA